MTLNFLKKQRIISNELYSGIKVDSELSDFFARSGLYVMHKVDKNELSSLFDSDNEDKKPDSAPNKKITAQTSQGGVFGKTSKTPPADNVSGTPNFTQPHSPTTPVKVK